jgi:asparagine synthase (glutamine-hydrolysing)
MFAFALWDSNTGTLFLARDRLGIKPLYYAELADGTVVFGSELKSLLLHPDLKRELDASAIEDYFAYGYVPDPKSIYLQARKLAPGHTLTLRRDGVPARPRRYWDVSFREPRAIDERAAADELIGRLEDAVRVRLVAEVPLGAFLSGGVDSSAVVAMMARLIPDPVQTCTISFDDPRYDESRYAAQVATRYGTNHNVRRVDANDFSLVDRLATLYDEPFADSSAIPTYRVCQLARERVIVALSGDGGDEVFAGYRRYRWHHYEQMVRSAIPTALCGPLFRALGRIYPKADWAPKALRAKSTLESIARGTIGGYFHAMSLLTDDIRRRLYSPSFVRQLQGYHAQEVLAQAMREAPTDNHISRIQYADMRTYLPGDILTKVDRASMAHSLEVRVPILDHPFVEWAASVPADLKLKGRDGKRVFKTALEPLLPDDVLYRDKMGFAVPLAGWFRGPLKEKVRAALTGPALGETGMFDRGYVTTLLDEHQSGMRDHATVLWSLLMFESFLRQVHENRADADVTVPNGVAALGGGE